MDMSEFQGIFVEEARDYLQSLNQGLLTLEEDPSNTGVLDEMFRAAHSLKGMCSTMGYDELANITHELENVFDTLRNSGAMDTTATDVVFASIDTLEDMVNRTMSNEPMPDSKELLQKLAQINEKLLHSPDAKEEPVQDATEQPQVFVDTNDGEQVHTTDALEPDVASSGDEAEADAVPVLTCDEETLEFARSQGQNCFNVDVVISAASVMKSARVYLVFQRLEELGTIAQSLPSAEDLEAEKFEQQFSVLLITPESEDAVNKAVNKVSEIEKVRTKPLYLADQAAEKAVGKASEEAAPMAKGEPAENNASGQATAGLNAYARVETNRLDYLINLVGELVVSRTQIFDAISKIGDDRFRSAFVQLERVTTELQHAAMKLRMVPIKQVFERFPRMVRDVAHQRNKDVRLELWGEKTELDRSIINVISEPIVHLLRNSVDHGIEEPDHRQSNGKPRQGTVSLGAKHEGNHIVIEISDDGQGINVERVKQKAIARGLVPQDRQEDLTIAEAAELLFHPGFSTAEVVDSVSGRGVGMDAVKSVVTSLHGDVEIDSKPGEGTRTSIRLPLTLAIIKALLVRAGGEVFAIPTQSVRENLMITPDEVKTVQQGRVINVRNEIVPLMGLAAYLGIGTWENREVYPSIILETRKGKAAFVIDEFIGQQEIVIKPIDQFLGDIKGITGATVLGDGSVALILDAGTLL